jgi:hypothetical protein
MLLLNRWTFLAHFILLRYFKNVVIQTLSSDATTGNDEHDVSLCGRIWTFFLITLAAAYGGSCMQPSGVNRRREAPGLLRSHCLSVFICVCVLISETGGCKQAETQRMVTVIFLVDVLVMRHLFMLVQLNLLVNICLLVVLLF